MPATPWSIPISFTPSPVKSPSMRAPRRLTMPRWSVGVLEIASGAPVVTDASAARRGPARPADPAQRPARARSPDLVEIAPARNSGTARNPGIRPHARRQDSLRKITPKFHLDLIDRKALGGKAIRKQITISFNGIEDSPKIHLLLYVPAKTQGDAPAIVGLNFNGNQTVDADPGIELPEIWT